MESPFGTVGRLVVGALATGALLAPTPEAGAAAKQATTQLVNGTLMITGTTVADQITVDYTGTDDVVVDLGAGAKQRTYDRTLVDRVIVRLKGGADTFTTVPGVAPAADLPQQIRAGGGDDTVISGNKSDVIMGGTGNDTLLGGGGLDVLVGGAGNDIVNGNGGADTKLLGAGNDTAGWIPGDGNDVVVGARGSDHLAFTGSAGDEAFSLAPSGDSVIMLRSLGSIRMDLVGVESVGIDALGGTDTVAVNDLAGTGLTTVDVDLSIAESQTDGATDTVAVNGTSTADTVNVDAIDGGAVTLAGLVPTTTITGADATDALQVSTGAGDDTVAVSDAASALMAIAVDLGADD